MGYIRVTKENIDREHICCAMSGKQSLAKKEWLKQRFEEGLVFYRSAERGKCFIEYIPAENAWVPIDAAGWLYINCLWVSGSMKGHGYSSELLEECLRDAKAQGKNGVCILCAEGRKREFLADPKFLTHKGFKVSDISDCGINLMYLPLAESCLLYTCPLLYRPVPLYLLLGAKGAGGRKGTWDSVQSHPRHRERDGTECARTGHNIRIVPGWEIRDTGHPVGQEIFEISRRSGLRDSGGKMQYDQTVITPKGLIVHIRNGVASDGSAVLENFDLTHAETDYLLSYPDENHFDAEQESRYLEKKATSPNEIELIAFVDGKVAGTAGIDAIGAQYKVAHRAEFGVSILKEYWGLGIGRALMEACIHCAKTAGYAQLELDVVAENARAIFMYQTAGFVEYGRNPKGFRSRNAGYQELISMRLEL